METKTKQESMSPVENLGDGRKEFISSLPDAKQQVVVCLSDEKFQEWKSIHADLRENRHWIDQLRRAQAADAIPQNEINQAITNLRKLQEARVELENRELAILSGKPTTTTTPRFDSLARPGGVSIRPLRRREFTSVKGRKPIKND